MNMEGQEQEQIALVGYRYLCCSTVTNQLFLDVHDDGHVSIFVLLKLSVLTIRVEFPMGKSLI